MKITTTDWNTVIDEIWDIIKFILIAVTIIFIMVSFSLVVFAPSLNNPALSLMGFFSALYFIFTLIIILNQKEETS